MRLCINHWAVAGWQKLVSEKQAFTIGHEFCNPAWLSSSFLISAGSQQEDGLKVQGNPLGLRAGEQGLCHLLAPSTDPTVLSPSPRSEDPGSFRKADLCAKTLGEINPLEACMALVIIPNSGKIPWRRKWQPTSGFLPGESHRQSKLVGYSP